MLQLLNEAQQLSEGLSIKIGPILGCELETKSSEETNFMKKLSRLSMYDQQEDVLKFSEAEAGKYYNYLLDSHIIQSTFNLMGDIRPIYLQYHENKFECQTVKKFYLDEDINYSTTFSCTPALGDVEWSRTFHFTQANLGHLSNNCKWYDDYDNTIAYGHYRFDEGVITDFQITQSDNPDLPNAFYKIEQWMER